MQQKNFVLFMITCLVILVGWMWLQNQLWPPRPRPKDDKAAEKKKKEKEKEKEKAWPVIAMPSLENIWQNLSAGQKLAAAVTVLPTPSSLTLLYGAKFPDFLAANVKINIKLVQPKDGIRTFTLGETDKSFITAVFTTKGGGIQKLTLNNFDGANRLGLPTNERLHLVQEDPFYPSFLMYHYPLAGKELSEHPDIRLGQEIWKTEGPKNIDDKGTMEISFSTTAPKPFEHLRITKTYRLARLDYHIGLTLEIKDTSTDNEAKHPFRYQLAGAHGLPIEGVWYTNIFRNSMIGMVDSRKSLWRTTEEARQISFLQGGERVPEAQRSNDNYLQYGGVVTQYFASMIVVDNEQEDMKNILAWARPTLETSQEKGRLVSVGRDRKRLTLDVVDRASGRVVRRDFFTLPRVE
ncbi:MAG TPA: YidC/Oxa1 family insertase periplasmic-domain containing protein, partial [Gemmataceae bacterium]|nr:YidC/Oxa1 family insertase periplasmic-domain containing protein [Gemmataceae bacterium]